MVDNVTLPGTGAVVASDDDGVAQHQYVKLELGGDGVFTKIPPGQQLMASSVPVALASNQTDVPVGIADGDDVALGAVADAAVIADVAGTISGKLRGLVAHMATFLSRLPAALGAGGGLKVDGSGTALPISAAALPLPAGAATQATLASILTAVNATQIAAETSDDPVVGGHMQSDVLTIAAGETHLGETGLSTITKSVVLSMDPNVHHANDVLAATQEIATTARVNGGGIELVSVAAQDDDDQAAADMYLWFLDANVVFGVENAAPSISDADAQHVIGRVLLPSASWLDVTGLKICTVNNIGLLMNAAAGTTSIWMAVTTSGTPTPSANGATIRLQFKRY